MAIPKIRKDSILSALKFIDEYGIPDKHKSTQYELVSSDGKKYPPKYVIAVANHIENGGEIVTTGYNAVEAKNYFESHGFKIQTKQERFELTITANDIISTDPRFSVETIKSGDNFKVIDTYFVSSKNEIIKRKKERKEKEISNQTLPRLAFQIYEAEIDKLTDSEKENFPVCRHNENQEYRGIFLTKEEFEKYKDSKEYLAYTRRNNERYYIYCWNIFSTLAFVQECLKRFGNEGDKFILIYREKTKKTNMNSENNTGIDTEEKNSFENYKNSYSKLLLESKNIVFRGAPGTGKSYLAKQIAADIISNGCTEQYTELTDEQKQQIEFVQFHPSYDYSDFVEGLRPKMNEDGSIAFELRDGVFKSFVEKARQNFENSHKPKEIREREASANTIMTNFFSNIRLEEDEFKTIKGSKFTITNIDDKRIYIAIPGNETVDKLSLNIDEIRRMLESGLDFEKVSDITSFFGKQFATQNYSYDYALFKAIKAKTLHVSKTDVAPEELKKYVFIIDEINRGEISKILGELFFSIDPGYRGKSGEVSTQYSNMHAYPNKKFYIPENVFIIGTMNDIDRSVDSFDFAMRRRFRFIEVKAESTQNMLDLLEDVQLRREALARMDRVNEEILKVDDLNENYQIGAAYFLKLKNISLDDLWNDYLKPLLQDYVHGLYDEQGIMKRFAKAYGCYASDEGDADEAIEN